MQTPENPKERTAMDSSNSMNASTVSIYRVVRTRRVSDSSCIKVQAPFEAPTSQGDVYKQHENPNLLSDMPDRQWSQDEISVSLERIFKVFKGDYQAPRSMRYQASSYPQGTALPQPTISWMLLNGLPSPGSYINLAFLRCPPGAYINPRFLYPSVSHISPPFVAPTPHRPLPNSLFTTLEDFQRAHPNMGSKQENTVSGPIPPLAASEVDSGVQKTKIFGPSKPQQGGDAPKSKQKQEFWKSPLVPITQHQGQDTRKDTASTPSPELRLPPAAKKSHSQPPAAQIAAPPSTAATNATASHVPSNTNPPAQSTTSGHTRKNLKQRKRKRELLENPDGKDESDDETGGSASVDSGASMGAKSTISRLAFGMKSLSGPKRRERSKAVDFF